MKLNDLINERIMAINMLSSNLSLDFVKNIANRIMESLSTNSRILICGNGGSASQASHFAAELTVRYKKKKNKFSAIALCTDYAVVTATSNDFSFDEIFSMQVENLGHQGDLLIVLSTSGDSNNVINALQKGKQKGLKTIAFLGKTGGKALTIADDKYVVNSMDSAIIQEHHLALIHLICECIENMN